MRTMLLAAVHLSVTAAMKLLRYVSHSNST